MAKKSFGAFPPKLTLQLEEMSDRFKWLSQKKPPATIWNPGQATGIDETLKRAFSSSVTDSEVGRWYGVGCFLNSDLAQSRLFIYTNQRYISDIAIEAISPGAHRNFATSLFLVRLLLETWAMYLDGLITISSLSNRPSKISWETIGEFQETNARPVKFLNWSSRVDDQADFYSSAEVNRDKKDPLRAENIIATLQRHAHLVPNLEKVYDACCHVIHPSSAIRVLYTTPTENTELGYIRRKATTPTREVERWGLEDLFCEALEQCESVVRSHEKKAETHLQKLEKAQIKINRRIGKDVTRHHPNAHLLPCMCGSEKTVPECCGRRAANPST